MVLTLYRIYIFCFQMCNRLPEIMKNGDAGIFPVYFGCAALLFRWFSLSDYFNFIQSSIITVVYRQLGNTPCFRKSGRTEELTRMTGSRSSAGTVHTTGEVKQSF